MITSYVCEAYMKQGSLYLDLDLVLAVVNGNLVGATHRDAIVALCAVAPALVPCQFPWEQHIWQTADSA